MTDPMRFDGEVAVITGAGRGLGAEYARGLAARGCAVVVNDLGVGTFGEASGADPAADVAAEIVASGGRAVADRSDIVQCPEGPVETAIREFGRIDIVVNNAGVLSRSAFADTSREQLQAALDVHVIGGFLLTQRAWPELTQRAGRVVFTSSSAVWGVPGSIPYAIGKSALLGLVNTLALEAVEVGVRVNGVLPGASTRMVVGSPGNTGPSVKGMVDEHLSPAHASAFLLWLVHRDNGLSGEHFTTGGGRAGRVLITESAGHATHSVDADAWRGAEDELFAMDTLYAPLSTIDSIGLNADLLGPTASAAYRAAVTRAPRMKERGWNQ